MTDGTHAQPSDVQRQLNECCDAFLGLFHGAEAGLCSLVETIERAYPSVRDRAEIRDADWASRKQDIQRKGIPSYFVLGILMTVWSQQGRLEQMRSKYGVSVEAALECITTPLGRDALTDAIEDALTVVNGIRYESIDEVTRDLLRSYSETVVGVAESWKSAIEMARSLLRLGSSWGNDTPPRTGHHH